MRRGVWAEYVSADGVVDEPSWTGPFWSDALLGRETYESFAKAWPTMTDESGFADRMNSLPKHVASRTLKHAEWNAR